VQKVNVKFVQNSKNSENVQTDRQTDGADCTTFVAKTVVYQQV